MLDVARCRELLGEHAPEADADVEFLRDSLAGLAEAFLDSLQEVPSEGAEREAS